MGPLMGLKEIAATLGVSRQRAAQLAQDYPDFPAPIASLGVGRVWDTSDIERWIAAHPDRRPGRPKKETEGPG